MTRFSLSYPDGVPDDDECTLALLDGDALVAEVTLPARRAKRLAAQLEAGDASRMGRTHRAAKVLEYIAHYSGLGKDFDRGDWLFVQEGIKSRIDGHGVYIDAVEAAARWLEAQGDIYPLDIFDGIGARALRWALARWPSEMRGALIHDGGPAPDRTLAEMFETGAAAVLDVLVARGYLTPAADRIEFTHTHHREVMTLALEASEAGWSVSLESQSPLGGESQAYHEGQPC